MPCVSKAILSELEVRPALLFTLGCPEVSERCASSGLERLEYTEVIGRRRGADNSARVLEPTPLTDGECIETPLRERTQVLHVLKLRSEEPPTVV